jgi:hypothetical protein
VHGQVDTLANEMRQLVARGAASPAPSTIVVQGGGGSAFGKIAFVAVPGAGVYVYMKYMGYGVGDLKWVSASRFQEAVAALGKAQDVLDTKLAAFREYSEKTISAFRAVVVNKFGEQQKQIEDGRVQRLEGKIDDAASQVHGARGAGICTACGAVSSVLVAAA